LANWCFGLSCKKGHSKVKKMRFLGLAICLGTIIGAAATVGIHLYFDILSFLFVLGGAIGFLVMKNNPEKHIANFGDGAVYFGWLGTLVGLIAITGDRYFVWGDVDKMGPALAVSMLTVLYGYSLKLVIIALARD
jgi:flagellar motor component MotA